MQKMQKKKFNEQRLKLSKTINISDRKNKKYKKKEFRKFNDLSQIAKHMRILKEKAWRHGGKKCHICKKAFNVNFRLRNRV